MRRIVATLLATTLSLAVLGGCTALHQPGQSGTAYQTNDGGGGGGGGSGY